MKRLKQHLLIVFIFSFTIASAQDNNSILWEINGNGLKNPSYLFGSFHLTDKRVFNFPDSVIAKLKECETAAFELNLDSVSGMMLEDAIKKAKKWKVNEILSKNEMEKLKRELKKKNISTDNLDNEVPLNLYNRYIETVRKKNNKDMNTFLDAYLFRIAHLYGKDIIGLETYAEQLNALTNLKDDDQKKLLMSMTDSTYNPKVYMDSLISLYIKQDINGIYSMISRFAPNDFENIVLIKRNYVMDRRIDSLIQHRSAFICVGTGHLPGTEGLIALLSKRGYTVKPLYSPKTGYYKTLLPDENTDNWKTIVEENGGYQLKMPGEPTPINKYGLEMKGYMDLGTGHFYLATSFPTDEKNKSSTVMDEMLKKMTGGGEPLSKKAIKYNFMHGYEMELKMAKTANYTVRLLNDTANIYLLMIGVANGKPDKNSANKFFNSLVSIKRAPSKEIVFKDDTAAFEIKVPSTFKIVENENQADVKYKTYSCVDYSFKGIISVSYIDYAPGLYFPDINIVYEGAFEPLKTAFGTEPEYIHDSTFKEYKCRDYKIIARDGSTLFARYILRCSRLYILSASSKNLLNSTDVFKRFSTFHFITPIKPKLQSYLSSEKDFTVMMPGVVQQETDSSKYEEVSYSYAASDPYTSNWFKIFSHRFSDFDHLKNDSTIFTYFKNYLATGNDSLIDSSRAGNGIIKIYNFKLMRTTNTDISENVRAIINGRYFYLLVAINDMVNPNDSVNENLFNSFKISEPDRSFDIFKSKSTQLLESLKSSDTTLFKASSMALKGYEFEKSDIPQIITTLKANFIDDTLEYGNTRFWIYNRLYALMDSVQKIDFIKNNYNSMPDSGITRMDALGELVSIQSKESIDLWKTLIIAAASKSGKKTPLYGTIGSMGYDSLPLISSLYPDLAKLLDNEDFKEVYYSISANALKHKLITTNTYSYLKDKIFSDARAEYKRMNEHASGQDAYYSSYFSDALYMLNLLPVSEHVSQLNREVIADTVSYSHFKLNSILYLVKNNVAINKKDLKKFLSITSNLNECYDSLKKVNRLDIFPSSKQKQKLFAEGDMYTSAYSDDEAPTKVQLLDTKKIIFNGQLQRFFLYRIYFGTDYSYFGMAGPYPLSDKELVTRGAITGMNYEEFTSKTLDEHVKKFLEDATAIK